MTDAQIMTLAISIAISTGAVIYSNGRVADLSKRLDDTNKHIDTRIDDLRDLIQSFREEMRASMATNTRVLGERIDASLKIHVLEHHK